MGKHELTACGIDRLTGHLYKLDDEKLQEEAMALASDPRGYIAEHFALKVQHLEYLRSTGEDCVMALGFCLASAIVARRPVQFREVGGSVATADACFLLKSCLTYHYKGKFVPTGAIVITMTYKAVR